MRDLRALVVAAIVTVGATASTVLSQARLSAEGCQSSLDSLERSEENVNRSLMDETARLRSLAGQLSEAELEMKRCEVWPHLETEAARLLEYLDRNKARLVGCKDQQWYEAKHAAWSRAVNGFRASIAECGPATN
jgi:TolA-binding protein